MVSRHRQLLASNGRCGTAKKLIMPVRIYDISKKLGLDNKEVLTKAKELGIVAARVASSSLDKITAEYLEGEGLRQGYRTWPRKTPRRRPPRRRRRRRRLRR